MHHQLQCFILTKVIVVLSNQSKYNGRYIKSDDALGHNF